MTKLKFYYIMGSTRYPFNGYENVILKITKETKTQIEGETFEWNNGNFSYMECVEHFNETPKEYREKMTIIKNNVQGWKDL